MTHRNINCTDCDDNRELLSGRDDDQEVVPCHCTFDEDVEYDNYKQELAN